MKELSHHILDIAMNSVRGQGSQVEIQISKEKEDYLEIRIIDNGTGIEDEMLKTLKNPFTTSRTFRKVGLGIPLFNDTCEGCGGALTIDSQVGKGTTVVARLLINHIDRPPMGDIGATIAGLMSSYENINFIFTYNDGKETFSLSTVEIKEALEGVSLSTLEVVQWIKESINESVEGL